VALAIAAGLVLTAAAPAFAAAPPWEPDPNTVGFGAIVLYDAAGKVLTGGSNLGHLADYAAATSRVATCTTKATLSFAAPDHTKVTGAWTTGSGSASTTFPNSSAPAPITGPGFANPLVTLGPTDADIASFLGGVVKDTTPGYANIYQLRLKDTGPAGCTGSGTKYWATDIQVDETAGTWTALYPTVTATTTSITTTPPNGGSAVTGANVQLSATVSPASNGSVQFFDGATTVGSAHPVTTSGATVNDTHNNPAIGTHTYKAVFTPTGGTLVQGSTSPTSTVTITPPATPTTTMLSASPTSAAFGAPVTLTANVTPLAAMPGSVQFLDGATPIGTDTTDGPPGQYQIMTSSLAPGSHSITATFTPSSTSFNPSTSPAVTVTVAKATPALTTNATPTATLGQAISDTATLAGGFNPTGTITFKAFANTTCTGTPAFTSAAVAVSGNGTYSSGPFTPSAAGTYYWTAGYTGDANNALVATVCGDSKEISVVSAIAPTTLVAQPAIARLGPPPTVFLTFTAQLSSNGTPLAGKTIVFSRGTKVVCSATTNAQGIAKCGGVVNALLSALSNGYNATFAGGMGYAPATAHGPIIVL
jgi:hypothetical protein